MSNITTAITFTLTHSRKLTEKELKNLVGNITEHIFEEQRADEGDWGFGAIIKVHCVAEHKIGGQTVMSGPHSSWGRLWGGPGGRPALVVVKPEEETAA